ncbi:MAG TPA: phage antirepressor KilAC domain-containing protein [Mucilaginibacter sp.]|jgi:phage antirepressor YoqD-like protein
MQQINLISSNQLPQIEQWYDMKKAAKLINAGMGRTKLFRYLRTQGFLMDDNEPYQVFIDEGLFRLVEKDIRGRQGQLLFRSMVTLISDKGIRFIEKYIADNGIN